MQTGALATLAHSRSLPLRRFYRCSRSVAVRVLVDGREVDSFLASSGQTLRDSLRPIFRHLPPGRGTVEFRGMEDEQFAAFPRRSHREVALEDLNAALQFLAG